MHRGNKKKISMFVSLAMMASLFAFAGPAAPVQAQVAPTFNNFLPLEGYTPAPGSIGTDSKSVLSNRFDGVDRLIHLTLVATQGADTATWWVCPSSGTRRDVGAGVSTGCTLIGSDSSPTTPQPGTPGSDSAFELFWDGAPLAAGASIVDILTRVCTGGACTSHEEKGTEVIRGDGTIQGVHTNQSGEKTEICFQRPQDVAPSGPAWACAAGWQPLVHGMLMQPALPYHIKAKTSADVTAPRARLESGARATAASAPGAASGAAPGNGTVVDDIAGTQIDQTVEFREYIFLNFTPGPAAPHVSPHADLSIYDSGNSVNSFDQNYVFFGDVQESIVATFHGWPTQAVQANFNSPDREDAGRLGETEVVSAQLRDQFDTGQNGVELLVESTDVGTLMCLGPTAPSATTPAAPGSPGDVQRCTVTTGTVNGVPGVVQVQLTNPDVQPGTAPTTGGRQGTPGDQVVTICRDTLVPAGQCAPGDVQDSATMGWHERPDHVHTVDPETGDPADPCHTGASSRVGPEGDRPNQLACVFDRWERPATTNINPHSSEPAGAYVLGWTVAGVIGVCPRGSVGFQASPPTQTGADGRAQAGLTYLVEGVCDINVTLGGPGNTVRPGGAAPAGLAAPTSATVTHSVTAREEPPIHNDPRTIGLRRFTGPRLRPRQIRVRGRVRVANDHLECVDQVPVRVQRRFLRGRGSNRFRTLRTITTGGPGGVYRTNLRRPVRAHRIRVIAVPVSVGEHRCLRAMNNRRVRGLRRALRR